MKTVFEKLNGFTPYQPPVVKDCIIADANESFLPPDEALMREISARAAQIAANRYPDPYAAGARQGFASYYGVSADCVTVGNGSDELLSVLICGFLQPGDRLVTLTPDFSMYPFYGKLSGAEHITLEKNADLSFDVDTVITEIGRLRPKMLVLSNPCNPSSRGLRREEMLRLVDHCGCVVVADEAYMDFWDESIVDQAEKRDNLIVLRTMSKIGYAAFRVGFAVACAELTALIRTVKSPYNVNALSQAAAETVFRNPRLLRESIAKIRLSRDELWQQIHALSAQFPGKFVLPESRSNFVTLLTESPKALHQYLLDNGISVSLNAGRYLRITCCSDSANQKIVRTLADYFQKERTL